MLLNKAESLVAAYETLYAGLGPKIDKRAQLRAALGDDKLLDALAEGLGGADGVIKLVGAMPKKPALADVVKAFGGDTKRLGALLNGGLGGDATTLAVLFESGCKGDPAKLVTLAETFKDEADHKALNAVVTQGGFAGNPAALAAILGQGCDGDGARLKTFVTEFADEDDRKRLKGVLAEGGLGAAPGALGALAKSGGGALLKKFGTEFQSGPDKQKLKDLLGPGGLGGLGNGNPETLASVTKAFGNDPANLKLLHAPFAADPSELGGLIKALDQGSKADSSSAGPRLKSLVETFERADGGKTPAEYLAKLKDPFLAAIDKTGQSTAAPPNPATGMAKGAQDAAALRAAPPAALAAPAFAKTCTAEEAVALLSPAERATLDPARKSAAVLKGFAAGVAPVDAPDPLVTAEHKKTVLAAETLTKALKSRIEGADPAEIEAVIAAAEAARAVLDVETDVALRSAAEAAVKAGGTAVEAALAALAARRLGEAGTRAPEARDASLRAAKARGLLDALGAGDVEKKALEASARANAAAAVTASAAAALEAAGDTATPGIQQALEAQVQGDAATLDLVAVGVAVKKANDTALAAAEAASAAATELEGAPRPVDPRLLDRAAGLAEAASAAAAAAPDKAARDKATKAAAGLAKTIAAAANDLSARVETRAALASPAAAGAVKAAMQAKAAMRALARVPGGPHAGEAELAAADKAGLDAAFTASEIAALTADGTAKAAAQDAARRAAAAKKGTAPDALEITAEETAANLAAKAAALLAKNAADALTPVPNPPTLAAIQLAQTTAAAALAAARLAPDDTERNAARDQAKRAADAASAATAALAKHHLTLATASLTAQSKAKTTTATTDQRAFVNRRGAELALPAPLPPTPRPPPHALTLAANATAAASLDTARAAFANAGAARAEALATADAPTQTARLEAAQAEAEAAFPGALPITKLKAAQKARDAAEKLSVAASAAANIQVNALSSPPDNTATPAGVLTPPAGIRAAIETAKAAVGCALDLVAQEKVVKDAAQVLLTEATARTKAPDTTPQDATDLVAIEAILKTTGADARITLAKTAVANLRAMVKLVGERAAKTGKRSAPGAVQDEVRELAGMAKFLESEGFITFSEVNTAITSPRADMIVAAATMQLKDPGGVLANPVLAPSANVDMEHFVGRHTRSHFGFEGRDLHDESEMAAMLMIGGQTYGLGQSGRTTEQNKMVALSGKYKPSSLWPPGHDDADVALFISAAISGWEATLPPIDPTFPPMPHTKIGELVWKAPGRGFSDKEPVVVNNHKAPPASFSTKIGGEKLKNSVSDNYEITQFVPMGVEILTMMDLHTIRKAIGR